MSSPANTAEPLPVDQSPIAGTVLPIQRAEELLATLPGVISARIVASPTGSVDGIHVLTTTEVGAKQTVRNIESALIAHLGMRVSHKKISVATSADPRATPPSVLSLPSLPVDAAQAAAPEASSPKRRLYFEDVEVRRSRSKGLACRVTLRKGDQSYVGEAEGLESERLRIDLAARAALAAILEAEGDTKTFAVEGCKMVEAFEREFVFVGVTVKAGRENILLTGSAEVRDSAETAAVLSVLDATNRWVEWER